MKQNPFETATQEIVRIAVERQEFFEPRPKVLAVWMAHYNELCYASRYAAKDEYKYGTGNPKDALLELDEKVPERYCNMIYDAWAASIEQSEMDRRGEKFHPLELKPNKTMTDWINMHSDPHYRYYSLYGGYRMRSINHILLVIGNGLTWNRAGYICDRTPSEEDGDQFVGYPAHAEELPKDLVKLAKTWRKIPLIAKGVASQNKVFAKMRREEKKKEAILERVHAMFTEEKERPFTPQHTYGIHPKFSLIDTMPANAHSSYLRAGREICEFILTPGYEYDWELDKKRFGSQLKEGEKSVHLKEFETTKKEAKKFLDKWT